MSKTQSSCEGDLDFLKTYYELTKKDFTGFAVGIKDICATGYLVVDTCFHYNGSEHLAIRKEPKDIYKCAIVYYGNNRKRFVPVENIKLTRE